MLHPLSKSLALRPGASVGLALAFLGLAHLVWAVLPAPATMALMSEHGPVEGLNAALYVVAAVLIVAWRRP